MSEKEKQKWIIRLFFSYASEQNALVAEVHEQLREEYDIWFDRDRLTGGDSLFEEISGGLGWCDYGVVFLSKNYIAKGWTNSEFRGLWTKQILERSKVILPIWYDVGFKEAYNFSPMVADLTAFPSRDPREIAKWIRSAVGVGEQSRNIYDPLKRALSHLQSDFASKTLWDSWAFSDGNKLVRDEWERIVEIAQDSLNRLGNATFLIRRSTGNGPLDILINGPAVDIDGKETADGKRIIYLIFGIRRIDSNSVYRAQCFRKILLRYADYSRQEVEEADDFQFSPWCTPDGQAIWLDGRRNRIDAEKLVSDGLGRLIKITHMAVSGDIINRRDVTRQFYWRG